jgi:uncharacterized membrane protein YfcA
MLLAVFGAGLIAGFLNVMAGGGSMITLPLLIFMGLPVAAANGTNRVAILVQNITAVSSFRRQGYSNFRAGLAYGAATIPGGLVGAFFAVRVGEVTFRAILAGVLAVTVVGLLFPRKRKEVSGSASRRAKILAFLGFFGIGFYGGFIQAGVGFLLMLVLHQLLRIDLVRTNMHKVLIVLIFSLPALAVFIGTGNVVWVTAAALAAGNALGAIVATRVSVKGGDRPIKVVLGVALLLMAVRLVW